MQLRREELDWREADGEILALDRRRGRYFTVSASGALLWPQLAVGTTEDALVAWLMRTYGIDHARARADVAAFLDWLEENDLLVR